MLYLVAKYEIWIFELLFFEAKFTKYRLKKG